MKSIGWILLIAVSLAGAAYSQKPMTMTNGASPACPAAAEPLPSPLAGWTQRKPLAAARDGNALSWTTLIPGAAADLTLQPASHLVFAHPPERRITASTYGGLLAFTIDRPGIVRIAIGSGAWIDLLDPEGHVVQSVAHSRGPICSGIRKMVDFAVQPGRYGLQIVGSDKANIPVLVAPLS